MQCLYRPKRLLIVWRSMSLLEVYDTTAVFRRWDNNRGHYLGPLNMAMDHWWLLAGELQATRTYRACMFPCTSRVDQWILPGCKECRDSVSTPIQTHQCSLNVSQLLLPLAEVPNSHGVDTAGEGQSSNGAPRKGCCKSISKAATRNAQDLARTPHPLTRSSGCGLQSGFVVLRGDWETLNRAVFLKERNCLQHHTVS